LWYVVGIVVGIIRTLCTQVAGSHPFPLQASRCPFPVTTLQWYGANMSEDSGAYITEVVRLQSAGVHVVQVAAVAVDKCFVKCQEGGAISNPETEERLGGF